ncbi:MAG TPA: zinc ribbon domain-containing protein [Gammaproteobacteria bacterium]|nr:zinc ribbon domain-containing protein [Gammaproteobacteria bacterium]
MPIYEYKCAECEHQFEKLQKISDDPLKDCPECNNPSLKKLVSAAGFRLKGKGWYETDFKSGTKRNVAESDSKSPSSASKDTSACSSCK